MKNDSNRKLVWAGLFTALITVATVIIHIPSPTGGYINAGDALVILGALILGPLWGAVAAGIGSALADILSGYVIYALPTLIIKALMALVAGSIISHIHTKKPLIGVIFGGIIAEIIMIAGYFAFSALFLGFGWGAVVDVPGNAIQGAFGVAAGTALYLALIKIPYVRDNYKTGDSK